MRWTRRFSGSIAAAALAVGATAAGCYWGGSDRELGWYESGPSGPDSGMAAPGLTASFPRDLAVDPASFDYVVLGSSWDYDGDVASASTLQIVDRVSGAVVRSWTVPLDARSIGMTAPDHAFISDGHWNHYDVDLATGAFERVTGMDAVAERTLAFADGASDDGHGTVATLECEPLLDSPVSRWGGEPNNRTLLASVPLASPQLIHTDALAYAPKRDLVFAFNMGDGIYAISTITGEIEFTIPAASGVEAGVHIGLAYDPLTDQIVQIDAMATSPGAVAIVAYDL
jgi:hypothetical protein